MSSVFPGAVPAAGKVHTVWQPVPRPVKRPYPITLLKSAAGAALSVVWKIQRSISLPPNVASNEDAPAPNWPWLGGLVGKGRGFSTVWPKRCHSLFKATRFAVVLPTFALIKLEPLVKYPISTKFPSGTGEVPVESSIRGVEPVTPAVPPL